MTSDLVSELDIARKLARAAGAVIMQHYQPGVRVDYKDEGREDPVTQADREANRVIVEGLSQAFPGDGILAEESPPTAERLARSRLWCVDPLDGTREFIDRNGQFVVMIGLAIDGEAALGVVFRPTEDVLFWGVGNEAFCARGGKLEQLYPTKTVDPAEAMVMVSRSHRSKTVTRVSEALGVGSESPLGSVGLKVTCVAQGLADIYMSVSNRTQEWDACAPEAILRAAGGQMTDCLGEPLVYNKEKTWTPHGLLATNGPLHAACVEALALVARERGWR